MIAAAFREHSDAMRYCRLSTNPAAWQIKTLETTRQDAPGDAIASEGGSEHEPKAEAAER